VEVFCLTLLHRIVLCCSEIAKTRFEPVKYFDDVVWPAYLRCLEEQRQDGRGVGQPVTYLTVV